MSNIKKNMETINMNPVLIINGSELEEGTIISDNYGIKKLEYKKMNFGLLRDIRKIVFNTSTYDIDLFLRENRNLVDSICCNVIEFEVGHTENTDISDDDCNDLNLDGGCYYCKDGILYRKSFNEEVLVKYPIGRRDEVVNVSAETKNEEVFLIGESAFEGAMYIKKVVFSGNISRIEERAFYNCISLETIESAPLVFIGADAFENCYSLKTVNVAEFYSAISVDVNSLMYERKADGYYESNLGVRILFSEALRNMLMEIDFHYGRQDWKKLWYDGKYYQLKWFGFCGEDIQCVKYTSSDSDLIVIEGDGEMDGSKLCYVFKDSFWKRTSLFIGNRITAIALGHEVQTVEDGVFDGSYSLVHMGESVKSIGDYVFCGASIESLVLNNSLKTIGEGAFAETFLKEMIIPDSVTCIENDFIQGDPTKCEVLSLPSTINRLAINALCSRSGIPRLILRGEKPPKDLIMWVLAGLWQWIDEDNCDMLVVPDSWKQYLNGDYFENAYKALELVDTTNTISKEECVRCIRFLQQRFG